jgi:hypothetical protein
MKDAKLPRLKGTLISVLPTDSGNALVLGLTDSMTPEVGLLVHDLPTQPSPGAQIEFEGIAIGFTRDPFLVMFDTDKDSIVQKPFGALAPSWYIGQALGEVKSGRYKNARSQVQFDLPSDWTVEGTHPSFDNGDIAILINSSFVGAYAEVWMNHARTNAEQPRVLFFTQAAPDDVRIFQSRFDQITSSVDFPGK